jgi:hypothetical protein
MSRPAGPLPERMAADDRSGAMELRSRTTALTRLRSPMLPAAVRSQCLGAIVSRAARQDADDESAVVLQRNHRRLDFSGGPKLS